MSVCPVVATILVAALALTQWRVTGQDGAQPEIFRIVNAATLTATPLAPGTIGTIFGANLAVATASAAAYPLPQAIEGTSVLVNGSAVPLYFVSPGQINFQVPYEIGARPSVQVDASGRRSFFAQIETAPSSPGIFSLLSNGTGPGALLHPDGRLVSRTAPVRAGGIISVFATGFGAVTPAVPSGTAAPASPVSTARLPVRARVGGRSAPVLFAGLVPGFAGLYQANLEIPAGVGVSPSIQLEVDGSFSNTTSAGGPGILDAAPRVLTTGSNADLVVRGFNLSPGGFLEFSGQRLSGRMTPGTVDVFETQVPATLVSTPGSRAAVFRNIDDDPNAVSNAFEFQVSGSGGGPSEIISPLVWVLSGARRAGVNDPAPQNAARVAVISAARGESEGFQIVVNGGADGMEGLDATVYGPLIGPDGVTIPAGNLALYREHWIEVTQASYRGAGGARAGWYPDALIPFVNAFTGQRVTGGIHVAAPFDVARETNQVVYAEVSVPPSARAGLYTGWIVLTRQGVTLATVPIRLTVWPIELPAIPSLRTAVQDYDADHVLNSASWYGYAANSAAHRSAAWLADETLQAHRMTPAKPTSTRFRLSSEGNIINTLEQNSRLEAQIRRPERASVTLDFGYSGPFSDPLGADRDRAINYLRQVYQWYETRGLLAKLIVRPDDEPETSAELARARAMASLIREANPNFKVAVTGSLSVEPFRNALVGLIDVFIDLSATFQPELAAARQRAGNSVWTYAALVQGTERPAPHWQLDFPLLNYRLYTWLIHRYDLSGLLYWTATYWELLKRRGENPWTNACSYRDGSVCYNGDGVLLYPGREVNLKAPAGARGGGVEVEVFAPVPSLRLKAIRDSLEDYELIVQAARVDPAAARQAVLEVACGGRDSVNCFQSWNPDPAALDLARERLAAIASSGR